MGKEIKNFFSKNFPLQGKKIWIAGHNGMVGQALLRQEGLAGSEILTVSRQHCDLTRQAETEEWIGAHRPDAIVLAAARVGGISANRDEPADFLYENLMIAANVIRAAYVCGVEKLLYLGSSCIYPREAAQPIREEALLSGPLEETNAAYALAKISGVQLCRFYRRQYGCDFISAMPCNLYGPGDNFDPARGHVIPALMRKAHEAKLSGAQALSVWGSGAPRREFLYVDDLAEALVFLLEHYSGESPVNVGAGGDLPISELAELICEVTGFKGALEFDPEKPDGVPAKLMDSSRILGAGWQARTGLKDGLQKTYDWYVKHGGSRQAA